MMNKLSQLEKTLEELVSFRSISGDKKAAHKVLDFVKMQLQDYPLHIREFKDDGYPILLLTTRDTLSPETLFVAHADVLPGPESLFAMKANQENLHGRGVWDMKFAIAGYIELVKQLGPTLSSYDFGILISSDEETRNQNMSYMINQGIAPSNAVLLDGSTDWCVESAARGAWTVKLSSRGLSAHGSRPWEGDSATIALLDALNQVRQWFPTEKSSETDTLNISILEAGVAVNQVPEQATAFLDMRFNSNEGKNTIQEKLDRMTKNRKVSYETIIDLPPLVHDLKNHYMAAFIQSAHDVAHAPKIGYVSYGASDAAHFLAAGIPCIVTRPMGGGHHSNKEWVDRKSLEMIVPILAAYLDSLRVN